jgi:FkbM family methyltransferase
MSIRHVTHRKKCLKIYGYLDYNVTMIFPRIDLISYSQNAEDIVLYRTFKDYPFGVYVDLGSGHPTKGSVTKNLHDKLGWGGVDVEPLPYLARELKLARDRSEVLNYAIDCAGGSKTFYEFPEDWALSTLSRDIALSHQKRGLRCLEQDVKCFDINAILEMCEVHHDFELLKVDVEGKDYEILKSLDFRLWRPWVILVESICPIEKTRLDPQINGFLEKKGYKEVLFDGINSFFLSGERGDLEQRLSVPANSRDFYVSYYWWENFTEEFRRNYPELDGESVEESAMS